MSRASFFVVCSFSFFNSEANQAGCNRQSIVIPLIYEIEGREGIIVSKLIARSWARDMHHASVEPRGIISIMSLVEVGG